MNPPSIGLTVCVIIGSFAAAFVALGRGCTRTPPAAAVAVPTHIHVWGPWSAPDTKSDWYYGTRFFQTRLCTTCGEAEVKVIQVSAGK